MLSDIFDRVARKHKIPRELVELVYKSFVDGIRYYLTNPLVSKTVIKIPLIGSFKMTKRSVENNKQNIELIQDYYQQFKRKKK